MPGVVPGTQSAAFYAELAAAFRLSIDTRGPTSAWRHCSRVAGTTTLATFVGEQTQLPRRPYSLRRISIREPVPVYPHALI